MAVAVSLILGYLLGSIDAAVLVTRAKGIDIYQVGSGNPGATNVVRALGARYGALVLVADLGKGVAAAAIGTELGGSELAGYGAGAMAVVGHCFPVWHRFRGGKGVATAAGMLAWLEPLVFLVVAMVWVVTARLTRISAVAALAALSLALPALLVADVRGWALAITAAVAVLVVARHRSNLMRLLRGREPEIR